MKFNPVRYSSQVGEIWGHFMFKVRYCHPIFDTFKYRSAVQGLFRKAMRKYCIRCKNNKLGFDSNHVHMELDLGIKSRPQICKELKGFVSRRFFKLFPELKLPKSEGGLFWKSGLWSPASFSNGSTDNTQPYLNKQKYGGRDFNMRQMTLHELA